MAARLEVNRRGVWLGELRMAKFVIAFGGQISGYVLHDNDEARSERYESPEDCMRDAASEVRLLLKAAGVDVA
jgi:hypothetical protein